MAICLADLEGFGLVTVSYAGLGFIPISRLSGGIKRKIHITHKFEEVKLACT